MDAIQVTDLKIIEHPKGDLFHLLKATDSTFQGFGEAYLTSIRYRQIKGWKKHLKMTLNLVVINGEVRFVIYDEVERLFKEIILSRGVDAYKRLTIPPGLWVAFEGRGGGENLVINIANQVHNPNEAINKKLEDISYEW